MKLGESLSNARKKSGLSQEEVAEKLGVSRQTISKWETDETLPDLRQSKKLALLYHLSLIHIYYVGPVIGAHSGPGTIALFFLGRER